MNDQQRAAMQMALRDLELIWEDNRPSITALREALAQPQDKGENNDVSAMAGVEQNRLGSGAKDGEVAQPLYTTPPSVEAAIEATKEKAAKVCEEGTGEAVHSEALHILKQERKRIAAAIREMK